MNWLKAAGQKYWQVLPIHPTGYADSPYQSPSAFAGNPLLIDLWELVELGLLAPDDIKGREYGEDPSTVDYEKVIAQKKELLHKAFFSFKEDVSYLAFIQEQSWWLEDYALFMAIKQNNELRSWMTWDKELRFRKPEVLAAFKERAYRGHQISSFRTVYVLYSVEQAESIRQQERHIHNRRHSDICRNGQCGRVGKPEIVHDRYFAETYSCCRSTARLFLTHRTAVGKSAV